MFVDDLGYVKKKWMAVIAISTGVVPIVGIVLWTMTFVGVWILFRWTLQMILKTKGMIGGACNG